MATIQRFIQSGRRTPNPRGISVPSVAPSRGGESIGNALISVGSDLHDIDERFRQARQVSQLSGLTVGLARAASDMEVEFAERQDYDKFNQEATDRIGKLRQTFMDQIGDDEEVLNRFMPKFDMEAIRLESGIRKLARSKFVDADRGALGNELDNIHELAGRSAGNYQKVAGELRAMAHASIMGRAASGVIGQEAAQIAKEKFDQGLWDNYFTAQIKSNPVETEKALSDENLFPGMSRSQRLNWQEKAADAATAHRIDTTAHTLIATHGTNFDAMYGDLGKSDLSRYEKSKAMDIIEAAEAGYSRKVAQLRDDGKKADLDNIYSMVNENNLMGAQKAIENAQYLTEEEKFQKIKSIKDLKTKRLWDTDPELEAKLGKRIARGEITETEIEFYRGLGLSNATTDSLKKRLANYGKDPAKDNIINEAVNFGESMWKTKNPAKDDLLKHYDYATFANRIRAELETMENLTRQQAVDHVTQYFEIKERERALWFPEKYTEADRLYQDEGKEPGKVTRGANIDPVTGSAGEIGKESNRMDDAADVPPEARAEIENILINAKAAVTPENIKLFYERNKAKFKGK